MRLFHKLLLLLSLCAAVPVLVLGTAGVWRTRALGRSLLAKAAATGDRGAATGRRALFEESRRLHTQVVERRARELQNFFGRGRKLVALQTALAARALSSPEPAEPRALYSDAEMAKVREDASRLGVAPYAMYTLAPGVAPERVLPALRRLSTLGDYYAFAHRETRWLKSLYVGSPDGFVLGYPGISPFPAAYDPRTRPWYEKAVAKGRITWSSIYTDKDGRPVITAAEPILDGERLLGVSAADIGMESFIGRMFELSELPATDALLVNFKGNVRIAATALPRGRFSYRSQPDDASPPVAKFKDGLFAPAFDAARAGGSGTLLVDHSGLRVEDPDAAPDGSLLAYAPVFLRTRREGKFWYLLVRTPMREVAGPAAQVSASLSDLQSLLAEAIDAQASEMGLGLLAAAAAALLLALLAAWRGADALTRPLAALAAVVRRIGKGDLEIHLDPRGDDEVAEVGRAINEMVRGLKEGVFVKRTFKRYLAASVVDKILADPAALDLGGEQRELTVFFSDMSGFTELSERMDPKNLVRLINEYLGAMTDSIFLQEGTLDKYEGDAVMAFWGAPVAQADHARRACWAALDNRSRLKELCAGWEKEGRPTFDIRIGINTGEMIVGNIGSKDRMEYTVLGDAVNIGARLEQANKVYGTHILISERTRAEAGGAIETREIDRMELKGRKETVVAHELLGLAGQIPPARRSGYDAYERGLAAYRERRWDDAEAGFREALAALGEDKASSVMLQRTLVFRHHPPPESWDGVFRVG